MSSLKTCFSPMWREARLGRDKMRSTMPHEGIYSAHRARHERQSEAKAFGNVGLKTAKITQRGGSRETHSQHASATIYVRAHAIEKKKSRQKNAQHQLRSRLYCSRYFCDCCCCCCYFRT